MQNQHLIRTFISINFSPNIIRKIHEIQNTLKMYNSEVKWTKPDNIHLTLKFLGEISTTQIEKIIQELERISSSLKPFRIEIKNIGFFPNERNPKIIWIGTESNDLINTAKLIEECLEKLIPKEEREFKSHITIGRVKGKIKDSLKEKLKNIENIKIDSFYVEDIYLMRSILKPEGPEYSIIKKFQFNIDKNNLDSI